MTCSSSFFKYPLAVFAETTSSEYLAGFYLRDLSRKYVVKFLEDFQSLRGSFAISFKIGKNVE